MQELREWLGGFGIRTGIVCGKYLFLFEKGKLDSNSIGFLLGYGVVSSGNRPSPGHWIEVEQHSYEFSTRLFDDRN